MTARKRKFILFILCFCFSSFPSLAQNYDYHREESPAISWNGAQLFDARMTSAGGISLMASKSHAGAINPALIPANRETRFGFSFNIASYEAYQYWGVNQGVIRKPDGTNDLDFHVGGLTFSFPVKNFRFLAGWYLSNLLKHPHFAYYERYWGYSGDFSGIENAYFLASAFKLGNAVDIGIKLDIRSGNRHVMVTEEYSGSPIQIQQQEDHKLTYLVSSVGAAFEISPSWKIGAVLVYPFNEKVKRTLIRSFESNYTEISDSQNCTDTLYRPVKARIGASLTPFNNANSSSDKRITIAAEAMYVFWSKYQYIFFSETLPRNLRNTMVLALGMEYGTDETNRDLSFRLGYRFDPQPVTDPRMTLHALTGGIGIRFGKIITDFGCSFYFGSSGGVSQRHFVLNGTISIDLKGGE